jgi:hypothetical protein
VRAPDSDCPEDTPPYESFCSALACGCQFVPNDMSVVACADSFAFCCICAWPDIPSALAVLGARNRTALATTINKRTFISGLLESGAAVVVLLKNRSAKSQPAQWAEERSDANAHCRDGSSN